MDQQAPTGEPQDFLPLASAPQRLIIFTRYPQPGRTKTRLIPRLGSRRAARLHVEMTRHVIAWAARLAATSDLSVEVYFSGGSEELMRRCFGSRLPYRRQTSGDLGRRMRAAFGEAFREGARRVVIVGTDCPELSSAIVKTAFARLRHKDVVLGPAADGGYYLLGLRREIPELFSHIPWGTAHVLDETLARTRDCNQSTSLLETLHDVDRPEDLHRWQRHCGGVNEEISAAKISIIIPTLDDDANLDDTLRSTVGGRNIETIVADADGSQSTREIARRHSACLVTAASGRASQMNAGAAVASGRILLFLHADTRLPPDFDIHVRRALAQPSVSAGAFRLRIDGARGSLRVMEEAANLRAQVLQMPYGDQAIFLTAELFNRLGRFPQTPILEDVDLIRRLQGKGRIAVAPAAVTTSARRWKNLGVWRTTIINQLVMAGYYLGVSRRRLARLYDRKVHCR